MKPLIQTVTLLTLLVFQCHAQGTGNTRLWYKQPATQWEEALPIGNGALAAMIFGGVETEQIQFNEETLWTGEPRSYAHKGAYAHLGEIRRLLNEGRQKEAEALANEHFMSLPLRQMAYQAFGDVYIDFPGHGQHSAYVRELDLRGATVKSSYQSGGVRYTREAFASYPAKAIYYHMTSSQKGKLNFTVRMDAIHAKKELNVKGNEIELQVFVDKGALNGTARMKVLTDGEVKQSEGKLTISKATRATLVLAAATNYIDYKNVTGDPGAKTAEVLRTAPAYEKAWAAHSTDYQKLFNRFTLALPAGNSSALPTDERLSQFKKNPDDPALLALYVQFARYLLIASSRPGSHPANLQGKWNHKLNPSWDSKYTVNINTEMNYWPAEMTNLSECHAPLFQMVKEVSETGAEVAREHYNAKGWVLHHNTDVWRGAAPINASNHGIWVTGGAWLSLHLWEHYRFTQDKAFLEKTAYPLMKGAAEFFLDFLVKDPQTGLLISSPSNSPENGGLVAGPAMDHQLIRALFKACAETAGILGTDAAFAQKLTETAKQIAPNRIGRYGQLQEWMADIDDTTSHHRHVSHLWGVYPGEEITPGTPGLLKAAMKSLHYRGDDGTGWSLAWKINYWARFLDGEHAYTMIRKLFNPVYDAGQKMSGGGSYPNLFDAHPPFQIDGNFGGAAGILETLVQSHLGEINLLPALPKALPDGRVSGLCARGGFEMDMEWKKGRLAGLTIRSKSGNICKLRYGSKVISIPTAKGKTYRFGPDLTVLK